MFTKLGKFPAHWFLKFQLIINVTLLPANYVEPKKIAKDFDKELWKIKAKVFHTGYPAKFINDKFSRFKIGKKNC